MTRPTTTPVLIVGAGPAGLVTALVLARRRRSIVLERHRASIYPRATAVSLRSWSLAAPGVEPEIAFSLGPARRWACRRCSVPGRGEQPLIPHPRPGGGRRPTGR
jgi:flavin-dependent dehydrogenase